jgi:PAS domain S-box-containing protein
VILHSAFVFPDTRQRTAADDPRAEPEYRHLLECSSDAIFVTDFDSARFLDVSPRACELLGYSARELRGMTGRQLHALDDAREVDSISADLIQHGAVHRPRVRLRRKDGSLVWSELESRTCRSRERKLYVTVVRALAAREVARRTAEGSLDALTRLLADARELPAPRHDALASPCRRVIREAERRAAELGHENEGFLSWSHGFMPRAAPLLRLDPAFAAWDELAAQLPRLYRDLELRRRVDELPVLDASQAALPDTELLRATALMAIVAQAYWNVELRPPERLPGSVAQPWAELRRRLGRSQEVLSYIDLIVYNWRVVDETLSEPLVVENLHLLLPTVDNREERVFYLTQLEILARCAPVVRLIASAQDAVLSADPGALEQALLGIIACLTQVVRTSLPKINPNPYSATHVDPVVWAKTVAPFAVPIRAGDQGPSGTSSPIFNALDVFFGRTHYHSFLGREIRQLRSSYPANWRAFLEAIAAVDVASFVEKSNSPALRGAWRDAFEMYVGPDGFLGRHRMKVYGYLELAFKVGRSVTIGGFGGVFKDRTWDQVDNELEASRAERLRVAPVGCPVARVESQSAGDGTEGPRVRQLRLDISGAGVRFSPGDRCAIYPENAPELVERTLQALGASGDEHAALTDEWTACAAVRPELVGQRRLSLRRVLALGCIRPVTARIAEALHARTQSPMLLEQLRRRSTERWELWELIELLRGEGLDPAQLWREPGVAASERLCQIVPPERPRVYSVASAPPSLLGEPPASLQLVVGHLSYDAALERDAIAERQDGSSADAAALPDPASPAVGCPVRGHAPSAAGRRHGTASSFLTRAEREGAPVRFQLERAARFRPPSDARAPVIFFAGGTGVSPFLSFLEHRLRAPAAAPCWLIWSLRSPHELVCRAELERAHRAGLLELDVGFTRQPAQAAFDARGSLELRGGATRRIEDILLEPSVVERFRVLLEPEHGPGAALYVCGRGGFARSVFEALGHMLARLASGSDLERRARAAEQLHRLVADQRLCFEVHTDAQPATLEPRTLDVSEIAEHNDERTGYWLTIDRVVYDLTAFAELHPGGRRVVQAYAGMDATFGYARAHHQRPDVDAMREMYRLGMVRALDFDDYTTEVEGAAGPVTIGVRTAYDSWVHALELVVEMQNALVMDYSLQQSATTAAETPDERSAYRLSRGIETHARFIAFYQRVLEGETLPGLWIISRGLFAPDMSRDWMQLELTRLRTSGPAQGTERVASSLVDGFASHGADLPWLRSLVELFQRADLALLGELKGELLRGVRVFERHERRTRLCGAAELRATCTALVAVLERATLRLASELSELVPVLAPPAGPGPFEPALGVVPRRLYTSRHWLFEEHPEQRLLVLQRTPLAWPSLSQLRAENAALLALLRTEQRPYGLLVDMRQAPIRNDAEFEGAMADLRSKLTAHFQRVSILLDSNLGELQVTRIERDERRHATITTRSESAALKFLSGGK